MSWRCFCGTEFLFGIVCCWGQRRLGRNLQDGVHVRRWFVCGGRAAEQRGPRSSRVEQNFIAEIALGAIEGVCLEISRQKHAWVDGTRGVDPQTGRGRVRAKPDFIGGPSCRHVWGGLPEIRKVEHAGVDGVDGWPRRQLRDVPDFMREFRRKRCQKTGLQVRKVEREGGEGKYGVARNEKGTVWCGGQFYPGDPWQSCRGS